MLEYSHHELFTSLQRYDFIRFSPEFIQVIHANIPTLKSVIDLYGYGLATLVMAEAFGMTGDPDLERYVNALAAFLTRHQHPLGGWRYELGQPGDITVTGWQVVALKSSQIAGAAVHSDIFRQADKLIITTTWIPIFFLNKRFNR